MHFRRTFLACLPILALAACGGGEDGGSGFGSVAQRPGDFGSFAEAQSLLFQFEPGALIPTRTPDAGFTGTATYEGALGFERASAAAPELIGRLTMTADLGVGTLSGSADNFVGADGSYVPGTVTLSGGSINSADATFQIQAQGNVGTGPSLVFNTSASGEFRGDTADQLTGEFSFDDGSQNWSGVFGAQRQ